MRPGEPQRGAQGFTLLGLLVVVALLGLALAAAGEVASTATRRERETQLLWVGHQYRAAIGRYWSRRRAYPRSLEELLGEAADPAPNRYLRRLYADPMTGEPNWQLLLAPDGGILGVASRSDRKPIKVARFDESDRDFENAGRYGDWLFTYPPGALPRPGSAPRGEAAPAAPAAPATPARRP